MSFFERLKGAASGTTGSKRMLMIVPAAAILAGGAYYMSSGQQVTPTSVMPSSPQQTRTVQGSVAPSPEMSGELVKADTQRAGSATDSGGSAFATLQAQPNRNLDKPDEDRSKLLPDDGIVRPAPPTIVRPQIVAQAMPAVAPVAAQPAQREEIDPMVEQTKRYLEGIKLSYPAADVKYYHKGGLEKPDLAGAQAQTAGSVNPGWLDPASGIKLPLPGTIVYATMVSGANSDTPGPVVAQIVDGELAGAKLVGSFQTQREGLFIAFSTLSMGHTRDGEEINKSIRINAVAVDSRTATTGMASNVDRHLLTNVGITAAAAFMQGLGQAIATSGQTYSSTLGGTTVINPTRKMSDQLFIGGGAGAGAAGQALMKAYGNRPPTVTVDAGTPVGVLFLTNGTN